MTTGFLVQFIGSLIAVAALVGLACWLGQPRPLNAITRANIGELLQDDAPGFQMTGLWIAADSQGAIARSGGQALMISRLGDGYVIRAAPWSAVCEARIGAKGAVVRLKDDSAPLLTFAAPVGGTWPPEELL